MYLKAQGNDVTVADFAPPPCMDQLDVQHFVMESALEYEKCLALGIQMIYSHKVLEYTGNLLKLESLESGEEVGVPANLVVLSVGVRPNGVLYTALKAQGVPNVYKAGDANYCSKIVKAVQAGSKFALALK